MARILIGVPESAHFSVSALNQQTTLKSSLLLESISLSLLKLNIKTAEVMKKVILPIDWSDNALRAFDWYLSHLHTPDSLLILIHFIDAANEKDLKEKEAKMMELQEEYETKLLQAKIDYRWITGSAGTPGEFILRIAKDENARYIIMGTRGLGKIKKAFLGSVSDYVLTHTTIPVIICKQ